MNSGLRLLCCIISGYALETRSLRDVGLSFAHDTLHGAPHDYFVLWLCPRCIVSLTLDPKPPVMYTHTCTHHTLVFDFALDIQKLCILGSGIPHKSNLLVFGFALDTRTHCTLFSGFTHKSHQPRIIRHSALAIDTCMGPSGTLGEWYSALPRRSEKKQPWPQEI